jgi:ABC-2 type transport system ATP-binding protein
LDIASKVAIVTHVRRLVRERGVGVLWTTHLLDEIEPDDNILVLHLGKPLAHGVVRDVVAASGKNTLRAAFTALTEAPPREAA